MSAWPTALVREVVDYPVARVVPEAAPERPFTYIDISAVDAERKEIVAARTMLGREAPSRARQQVLPADVLVSTTRPNLNAVAKVPPELAGAIASTGFAVLRPRAGLDADYLLHWTRSPGFVAAVSAMVKGALYPAVTDRQVLDLMIPLPPLKEQRRIAARLGEQLAEISLGASAAQARIDQMNSLAQRAIDADIPASDAIALGHTLRAPLRTGLSRAASATANHRVLTLSSVRNGVLDVGQNRPMGATGDEALANAVRPSTFYVVRGNGSVHMAGAGALSPESTDGVVLYPDLLIQVDPDPALLSVEYLALAWRSNRVRRQVETRLRTSAGIHKINLANLSTVDVPVPQLDEQHRIVARLHEQLEEIDRAKAALDLQLKAVDALPAALLREVFGADRPASGRVR